MSGGNGKDAMVDDSGKFDIDKDGGTWGWQLWWEDGNGGNEKVAMVDWVEGMGEDGMAWWWPAGMAKECYHSGEEGASNDGLWEVVPLGNRQLGMGQGRCWSMELNSWTERPIHGGSTTLKFM